MTELQYETEEITRAKDVVMEALREELERQDICTDPHARGVDLTSLSAEVVRAMVDWADGVPNDTFT